MYSDYIYTQTPKNIRMKKLLLSLLVLGSSLFITKNTEAQRYITPVFPSASVTNSVVYGRNIEVLTGTPTGKDLLVDVYQPAGAVDPITERPLVVVLHTGSFLPPVINGQPTGSRRDSTIVQTCTEFAKRGYVAAAVSYRLGWNPAATGTAGQDIRTGTLLQAVYRALLDAKAAVRYFRKNATVGGNTFGIDTNKIVIGGFGTGGYIALAYATLDDPAEISLSKFLAQTTNATYGFTAGQSYVNQSLLGDFEGYGGNPALNIDTNSVGYNSAVQFVFNAGGAMGDSSWMEPGDAPTVCFHVVGDPFAPYGIGDVVVPTTGDFVVEVSGSQSVIQLANADGNNNCMIAAGFSDPLSTYALANTGNSEGLYPFFTNPSLQAGPWEWYDSTVTVLTAQALGLPAANGTQAYQNSLATNPNMSKAKAVAYIDTIMGYLNPRMAYCLNLTTGLNNVNNLSANISIQPNPAADRVTIKSDGLAGNLNTVRLFNLLGEEVFLAENVGQSSYTIERRGLAQGLYIVKMNFDKGDATGKVVFK